MQLFCNQYYQRRSARQRRGKEKQWPLNVHPQRTEPRSACPRRSVTRIQSMMRSGYHWVHWPEPRRTATCSRPTPWAPAPFFYYCGCKVARFDPFETEQLWTFCCILVHNRGNLTFAVSGESYLTSTWWGLLNEDVSSSAWDDGVIS